MDLSKCVGAPLIGSLPHFYKADESLLEGVEGLNPVKVKIIFLLKTNSKF